MQHETAPAIGPDGKLNWPYLTKQCPRIFSLYREVLRLNKRDLVIRNVVQDTIIAGKHLRKGGIAVIPTFQLHDDPDTYGPDAKSFKSDRFLKDPKLVSKKGFLPFGGGCHLCPGQHVAALEIIGLAAVMINRFDIKVAWPSSFPRRDDSLINVGISRPVLGDDLFVTLSSKSGGS